MKKIVTKLCCSFAALCIALPIFTSCNYASPAADALPNGDLSDQRYSSYMGAETLATTPEKILDLLKENSRKNYLKDIVSGEDVLDFVDSISLKDHILDTFVRYEDLVTKAKIELDGIAPVKYDFVLLNWYDTNTIRMNPDIYCKLIFKKDDNSYFNGYSFETDHILYKDMYLNEPYEDADDLVSEGEYYYLQSVGYPGLYGSKNHYIVHITDDIACSFKVKHDSPIRDEAIRQIYDAAMTLKKKITGKDYSEYGYYKMKAFSADEVIEKLSNGGYVLGKNNTLTKEEFNHVKMDGSELITLVDAMSMIGYELEKMNWYEDVFITQLPDAEGRRYTDGESLEFYWKNNNNNSESVSRIRCVIDYNCNLYEDIYEYVNSGDKYLYNGYKDLYCDGNGGFVVELYPDLYCRIYIGNDCPDKDDVIKTIYDAVDNMNYFDRYAAVE